MKVHRDLNSFHAEKPVLTIGTFDGVHLGHKEVIKRLCRIAQDVDGESVIFTFDPHPRKVVAPSETNLRLLTTLDEKIALLGQLGIAHLIVFPFTTEFAQLDYEKFVEQILVDKIHIKSLVVGYDHRFGKDRKGSFDLIEHCAVTHGFDVEKLDVLLMDELNISSTKIRAAIAAGDFSRANTFLGYPFSIKGVVVEGRKLGRTIGWPTANIEVPDTDKIIPGRGVYAVQVTVSGQTYRGMLNIGSRPTVNNCFDRQTIEVNIFDFDADIYGKTIELTFFHKLRDERNLGSIDGLKSQLANDKAEILAYFG